MTFWDFIKKYGSEISTFESMFNKLIGLTFVVAWSFINYADYF
jgi:hypothetical protein